MVASLLCTRDEVPETRGIYCVPETRGTRDEGAVSEDAAVKVLVECFQYLVA
jgi:hypothetical protein